MASEKFKDFEDTNVLWTWIPENDDIHFKKYHLDKLVASDTDSCMMRLDDIFTEKDSVDDVMGYADALAQETNSKYPEFMMRAFNIPEERKNLITTDREAIADKSIFLGKKFYIMHLLNNEGVPCDEYKIMGVELKKSNFGDFLKYGVWRCVEHIFADGDEAGIKKIIKELKEEFYSAPLEQIGTPISCKSLKKYNDIFNETESYKGLYWSAKGAIFYNQIRSSYDPPLNPGDKAYSFYITGQRVNNIAFPLDTPIPEWAYDLTFDRKRMWEGVNRAIQGYMKAIGWDFKSKAANKRKELFGF